LSVSNKYSEFKDEPKRQKFRLAKKRVQLREEISTDQSSKKGIVISSTGTVNLIKSENGEIFEGKIGGTLKTNHKKSNIVAVGDKVEFISSGEISLGSKLQKAKIISIGKRSTKLSRRSPQKKNWEHVIASNADQILIFVSADKPKYNKRLIDRYLVSAVCGDLEPIICINKCDLSSIDELEEDLITYLELDYPVHFISLKNGQGTNAINKILKNKSTVITGPSGVGKSTLVNYILQSEEQMTGEVSERTAKGMHTTSSVRMFELTSGGNIIDTPGIREFALWEMERGELATYFKDFLEFTHLCKFTPCTHTHEPECGIIRAAEDMKIDLDRYESYLLLLESLDSEY
jgi:ribosome biogenesis GTPase / thiamine phosphate phosphatase